MLHARLANVRALHLAPHQGVGGLTRFLIEFVRHERMDGASDEILLTERALDLDKDFQAPATPVHFLGLVGESLARRAQRLADLAESRGVRTLHAYTVSDLILAGAAVRRRPELRLIATLFEAPAALPFLERRRQAKALRAADALFAPSPALAEAWASLGPKPAVHLPAVDIQRFHPQQVVSSWRAARLPDPEILLVGSLMRAVPSKGHDVLIEAVERRNVAGGKTALMLVGDGPRYAELKERAHGSDTIFVRRRVRDAPGFFGKVDVFAIHAQDELVPMGLLEALSCGRPAIVADRGPVASMVGPDAALFVEPGDVDGVVRALDRLADPEERSRFAAAGRERALQQHNMGALRSALQGAYA